MNHTDELESRIQSMLDGSISRVEFQQLEQELTHNPQARELYYKYASLHQSLEFRLSRSGIQPAIIGLADARATQQRSRMRKYVLLSTAALLIISLGIMQLFFTDVVEGSSTVALAASPGAQYTVTSDDGKSTDRSTTLKPNTNISLNQGSIELNFESGVRALITGPADLKLLDGGKLNLNSGTAWFNVPKEAIGFTVNTQELRVVDLGTEFGVISSEDTADEVHVFTGKVRIEGLNNANNKMILSEGEAIQRQSSGELVRIAPEAKHFETSLPDTLPHIHWSFENQDTMLTSNSIPSAENLDTQLHSNSNPSQSIHFTPGKFGNSLNLDGISSYVTTNWDGILGDRPRTVALWFKPNKAEQTTIYRNRVKTTILGWGTQQKGAHKYLNSKWTIHLLKNYNKPPTLVVSYGSHWYTCPNVDLSEDRWYHIVVISTGKIGRNGSPETEIYIDGESSSLKSHVDYPDFVDDDSYQLNTTANTPFEIGANLSYAYGRLIDDKPLLSAQIDELYIIEGEINESSVRHLMNTNQLKH